MEFDRKNPLPDSDDDSIATLFTAEADYMTSLVGSTVGTDLDLSAGGDGDVENSGLTVMDGDDIRWLVGKMIDGGRLMASNSEERWRQ